MMWVIHPGLNLHVLVKMVEIAGEQRFYFRSIELSSEFDGGELSELSEQQAAEKLRELLDRYLAAIADGSRLGELSVESNGESSSYGTVKFDIYEPAPDEVIARYRALHEQRVSQTRDLRYRQYLALKAEFET